MTVHRALLALSLVAFPFAEPGSAAESVFTSPRLEAVTSWIGNSYPGAQKWVQQDIHALAVTPEGTVFTDVPWDEGGGNAGEYRDGELVRYALHTHGWGYEGGDAVAFNSKYVFIGEEAANEGGGLKDEESWPPKGKRWIGVSRRLKSDISKAAPFEGGKGGKGDTLKSAFLPVAEMADDSKVNLPGLCADEGRLCVADPVANEVRIYDPETMRQTASWKAPGTGPLAMYDGVIWMLVKKTEAEPGKMIRFSNDGKADALALPAEVIPAAFCFASDGRLMVFDDGPSQQIRIYAVEAGALKQAGFLGKTGGIAGDAVGWRGAMRAGKFNHLSAIGCDANGNLYVAHDGQSGGGGTVLESYRLSDGHRNWQLLGLTFVDMADFNPANENEIFTKEERIYFDPTESPGKEGCYEGYTLADRRYPQDPRLHIWSGGAWVRRIEGKRFLFVNDMNSEFLQVYRFDWQKEGETAIPSGLLAPKHLKAKEGWPPAQPASGEWIWRDGNGDAAFEAAEYQTHGGGDAPAAQGWWVDAAGGVWQATETQGIRYFPFQGLDKKGNPKWSYETLRTFPHPAEFKEVKRVRYDVATDTLYLGGTTAEDKNQHWKPMGPVVARYDHWLSQGGALRWKIVLPYAKGSSGHESCEPMSFDIAGDFLFAPYTGALKEDHVTTGRVEIFRIADGSAVGHVEPSAEVGEIGLQDLREDITAHLRKSGEYDVMIEDDFKSKVVLYRLKGLK